MAKFGDDRSRDRNLDTGIDMEEMDDLNIEDPMGGMGGVDDGGGRSPAKANRRMVTEGAKGMAEGAMSAVGEEIERNMPNVATVKSELTESYQDLKDMKDEIARQLQPMMQSMENTTRKILPRVEKLMPKSWYSKIVKTLDERAAERQGASSSKEQERADLITSELSQVFGQQVELNKHNEFEQNKARLMDRAISSTQHKASQHAMARIYDSLRSTEIFHRTLHTAYMKKSLELQYKHLFVAQDTHNLLAKSMDAFEGYLKGIVKNTGLPDVMKTQASDYIKKSRTEKYGTMMADYLQNARKMIFDKIKSSVKDLIGNVGFAASGLEMGADSLNMMDEMAGMTGGPTVKDMMVRKGGGLLGKFLAAGPVRTLFDKIAPYTTTVNGELENVKTRAYMGLDKLRSNWAGSPSWIKQTLASFLPSIAPATTASNDFLTHSEDAATFDRTTYASINEIIPGWLGKICHEVAKIRDPNAELQTYNIYKRDFTTVGELQKDIYTDSRMFGGEAVQTDAVGKALATLTVGNERRGDTHGEERLEGLTDTISRIIANHSVYVLHFDPEALANYLLKPEEYAKSDYITKIHEGIDEEEFNRAVESIVHGLTDKNKQWDKSLVRKFSDAIHSVRTSADGMKERMPWLIERIGYGRFMQSKPGQQGILNGRDINMAFAAAHLAKRGTDKQVADWQKYEKQRLSDYLVSRDYAMGNVMDTWGKVKDSAVGGALIKGYNQVAAHFSSSGDKTDDVELGKNRGPDITAASETTKRVFGGVVDKAGIVASHGKGDLAKVESLIREANEKFAEVDAMEISDTQKNVLRQQIRQDLERKHGDVLQKMSNESKMGLFTGGLKRVSSVILPKSMQKKVNGWIPKDARDAKKKWKRFKKDFSKWGNAQLDKLPQSEEEVDQMVDSVSESIIAVYNERPKDIKEAREMARKLRDKIKKDHPEAFKRLDTLMTFCETKLEQAKESRVGRFATATGKYVAHKADPYVSQVKAFAVDQYKKAKAFSDPYINDLLSKTGVDPELVRKAASGDKEAQKQVMQSLEMLGKKEWGEVRARLSKDKLAQDWIDVKSVISESPENAASALGSATSRVKGFFGQLMDKYREGAGIEAPEEEPTRASVSDSDGSIKILKAFKESVTTEHNAIFDMIDVVVNQLKAGVPSLEPGKGNATAAASDIGAILRKRYGMFGRGGQAIGSAIKGLGKAGLWTVKKGAGLYAKAYSTLWDVGGKTIGGIVGAAKRFGGWMSNTAGLNPYVDIYIRGQEDKRPRLTWRKQAYGQGVVYGVPDGDWWKPGEERVMSSPDIVKRGVPIFDPKSGKMLIEPEDLKAGLWAAEGPLSAMTRITTATIRGAAGIYGTALKAIGAIGKIAAEGIFGKASTKQERYFDVYRKDEVDGKPLVTRRQQVKPGVFFVKDGKRVKQTSDIHEPIMDKDKQILIDDDDIEHGLVDVNNKPLGASSDGKEGLLGKAFNLGNTLAKGLFGKTGLKIAGTILGGAMSMYKGLFEALLGGGKAVGRGIANIGARIFGFDTPTGFGAKAFNGLNSRLDKLIDLVSRIVANGGGGGGTVSGAASDAESGGETTTSGRGRSGTSRENASSGVTTDSRDHYVHTNHGDRDGDGVNDWEENGENGSGEGEGMGIMDAIESSTWIPKKWKKAIMRKRRSFGKFKKGVSKELGKNARSLKRGGRRILKDTVKGFRKGGIRGARDAARTATRSVGRTAGKSIARSASRVGKVGKLGKLMRYGGKALRFGGKWGIGMPLKYGAKGIGLGLRGLGKGAMWAARSAKFLGPLAAAGMAAWDGYNGWKDAGKILGKDDKDLTTGDKAASAAQGIIDGATFGIASGLGNKMMEWTGQSGTWNQAAAEVMANPGEALKSIGAVMPWSSQNQELKKLEAETANLNKKQKDLNKKIIDEVSKNAAGYDIGGFTKTNIMSVFQKFKKSDAVDKKRIQEAIDKYGNVWDDSELIAQFGKWIRDNYPPDTTDPKGRLEYFRKMYKRSDRDKIESRILKSFGIVYPKVDSEWDKVLKELENAAGSKDGEAPKDTAENAVENALKTGPGALMGAGLKDMINGGNGENVLKGSPIPLDPVKKFEAFKKIFNDKDRMTKYDKGLLQAYGIDAVEIDDPEAWNRVYGELESAAAAAKLADTEKYKAMEASMGKVSTLNAKMEGKDVGAPKPIRADGTMDFSGEMKEAVVKMGGAEAVAKMSKKEFHDKMLSMIQSLPAWKNMDVDNSKRTKIVEGLKSEIDNLYDKAKADPQSFESEIDSLRWRGKKDKNGKWIKPDKSIHETSTWAIPGGYSHEKGGFIGNKVEGWEFDDDKKDEITKWENGKAEIVKHSDLRDSELFELMHTYNPEYAKKSGFAGYMNEGRNRALTEFRRRMSSVVDEYIMSIGGEEAVKKMKRSDFMKGLNEFAMKKGVFDRLPKDAPYQVKNAYSGNLMKVASDKFKELVPEAEQPEELSESRKWIDENLTVAGITKKAMDETADKFARDQFASIKPPLDTSQLTPPKKGDIVSANELALESGMMQKNQIGKVTSAIKDTKQKPPMTDQQMQDLLKSTQQALMGYSKFSEAFMGMCDKDGLKISGMPELTAVTAASKNTGAPQIINNTVIQEANEGLDLRKKQM